MSVKICYGAIGKFPPKSRKNWEGVFIKDLLAIQLQFYRDAKSKYREFWQKTSIKW